MKEEVREFMGILALFLFIICLGFLELIFWIREKIKALLQRGINEEKVIL